MTYAPGTHSAHLLLEKGLWFDTVVRTLVAELGLSTAEAQRATHAAMAENAQKTERQKSFA